MEPSGGEFQTLMVVFPVEIQLNEAKKNVKDAIGLYLEDLKEEGKPILQPSLLRAEPVSI